MVGRAARLAIDGGGKPQLRAPDSRSWTPGKERRFLEALAESCNVKYAAGAAGISASAVYVRRGRDAGFRKGWDQALAIGYAALELTMLERALHGVEKIIVARDGSRSMMRDYSDRLGISLLRMHREGAAIADSDHAPEDVAEAAERILARLKKIGERDCSKKDPSTIPAGAGTVPRNGRGGEVEVKGALTRLELIVWGLRA
ncbi:hypothetical protein [Sphingomonas mesophila]|uniref:hypothetical protein n=1 Tax=Sphingomonas mesophila TaxID=2303576 RepID=UPI000E598654|nr:hypothetical protein [Sphingomonas mesophila]